MLSSGHRSKKGSKRSWVLTPRTIKMMMTLRSFVLVLLVAMASAMPAAAMHDKNMDSRLEKLEKKIAALVATKTASSKQVCCAPPKRGVCV